MHHHWHLIRTKCLYQLNYLDYTQYHIQTTAKNITNIKAVPCDSQRSRSKPRDLRSFMVKNSYISKV